MKTNQLSISKKTISQFSVNYVNVGTGAMTMNINIGTGAMTMNINIGTGAMTMNFGTGAMTM
jgi:hypothetical protein